jgi:hypothetical protein
VRLEKKHDRDEPYIERFVEKVNNYEIIPRLQHLVDFKDSLMSD